MALLNKSDIDLSFCKNSPDLDLIIKYITNKKPRLKLLSKSDMLLHGIFAKAFFKPEVKVYYKSKNKKKIKANIIYHDAVHAMFAERFGFGLRNRPRLTLLGESLASLMELYFVLCSTDFKNKEYQNFLAVYSNSSDILRMGMLKLFNQYSERPFEAYKAAVLEMMLIYDQLLAAKLKDRSSFSYRFKASMRLFKNKKWSPYFFHYDFPNNILFVEANCGLKSDAYDVLASEKCLKRLQNTKTMIEFLEWLCDSG